MAHIQYLFIALLNKCCVVQYSGEDTGIFVVRGDWKDEGGTSSVEGRWSLMSEGKEGNLDDEGRLSMKDDIEYNVK